MPFYDDEYSSDISTTGVVAVGSSIKGAINFAQDADWIKTTLVAGVTYVFRIYERQEFHLTLRDSAKWLFTAYGQDDAGPAFEYTPASSGDYFLAVSFGFQPNMAAYTLGALLKKDDAVPGNTSSTTVLAPGATVHGKFESAGDSDWYLFHAAPGQHYAFNWSNDGTITRFDIFDSAGQPLYGTMLEVAQAGDYFIAVAGNRAGDYDLQSLLRTDDYSANSAAPGLLRVGGQITGEIEYSGDIDRIDIDLQGGTVYTLTLAASDNLARGMMLELYDAADHFVSRAGYNDNADTPRQLTFTAPSSGSYSLKVSYNYVTMSRPHSYSLTASGGVADDYGDTMAGASTIALNTTVGGQTAHAQDIDMLKATLKAGVSYNLKLWPDSAYSTVAATSAWLSVSGPDGATEVPLARADTGFTPATDGAYYFAIHAGSDTPEHYLFRAAIAPDDFAANAAGSGRLALNGSANGTLESSADRDWFALDMRAGQTFGVALKYAPGITLAPDLDRVALKIVDAQGQTLASATPRALSNDPALSYTATASGTYYVEIGAATGTYLLGASLIPHDDAGNTAATAAALPTGAAINGTLEVSSDIDYYQLAFKAGETYALWFKDGAAGRWHASIDVAGSDDVDVRTVHNGSDPYTLVTASADGKLDIKISGESGAPALAYQLRATVIDKDDYGSDAGSSGALGVGGAVRGIVNYADDSDWFKVTLQAGITYQFTLQGVAGGHGALAAYLAPLTLYDSSSATLPGASSYLSPGSGSTLGYTAAASGNYYVQVKPGSPYGATSGSYQLSAAAIPARPQLLTATDGEAGLHPLTDKVVLTFNEAVRITDPGKLHLLDAAGTAHGINLDTQRFPLSDTVVVATPNLHWKPGTSYQLVIDSGALVNAAGVAFDGLNNYSFTTVSYASGASAGDDLLRGQHNGATVQGGAGIDTVLYTESDAFFHISRDGNRTVVSYLVGASSSDTLVDVERLLFNNTAIALDIDGHGGQAYRLYQAAFGRTPDMAGLGYWINALDKGSSVAHVADEFVNSAEFLERSGGAASDDATFVTLLYNNVLHRTPDSEGQQYWRDALLHGASRADLLQSFSESAENQGALIGVIGNGFAYTPSGG